MKRYRNHYTLHSAHTRLPQASYEASSSFSCRTSSCIDAYLGEELWGKESTGTNGKNSHCENHPLASSSNISLEATVLRTPLQNPIDPDAPLQGAFPRQGFYRGVPLYFHTLSEPSPFFLKYQYFRLVACSWDGHQGWGDTCWAIPQATLVYTFEAFMISVFLRISVVVVLPRLLSSCIMPAISLAYGSPHSLVWRPVASLISPTNSCAYARVQHTRKMF